MVIQKYKLQHPIASLLVFILTCLMVGCSTEPNRSAGARAPLTAGEYLKLAEKASIPKSVEYQLRAADLMLQGGDVLGAQGILREAKTSDVQVSPLLQKVILEARLALLKQEVERAKQLISTALAQLPADKNTRQDHRTPQRLALLLPSKGPHAEAAKTIRDGFLAAYYNTLKQGANDPTVQVYDTEEGSKIREAYEKALAEKADVIVGPLTKAEVKAIAKLHPKIPVLALNTLNENETSSKQFYQFGLLPEDEVIAVAAQAKRQGKHQALVIVPQTEWGQRMLSAFKQAWQKEGGTILDVCFVKPKQELSGTIQKALQATKETRRQDIDMIFLAASPELARQVKPLLNFHHAENLPVYATGTVFSGTPAPTKDHDLNGIHFCDMPWVLRHSSALEETRGNAAKMMPGSVAQSPRFFALGMDAYQLATDLNQSERLHTNLSGYTGSLSVNSAQRIQRGLECAKFQDGVPVPD